MAKKVKPEDDYSIHDMEDALRKLQYVLDKIVVFKGVLMFNQSHSEVITFGLMESNMDDVMTWLREQEGDDDGDRGDDSSESTDAP